MSKVEKKTAPKKETKKETKTEKVPTSKPVAKKAAQPKAPKPQPKVTKNATKPAPKKTAKPDPKKASKPVPKKVAKKDPKQAQKAKAQAPKKVAKKVEKKDTKPKAAQKKEENKKPTLPAVIGRGTNKSAPKAQKKLKEKILKKGPPKTGRRAPAELPQIMKDAIAPKKDEEKPKKEKKRTNPHIIARPKSYHIGGDLPPKRDLSRMVKWPKYIRLQRKKKIMYDRLKIPAMINQFTQTIDKHAAKRIFLLLRKYCPETARQRKARLLRLAKAKRDGRKIIPHKPLVVKQGVSHVAQLVEKKKAKLVLIANDVDPIEHVLFLPTLCRKMGVPYCIVKNKARLGRVVHMKTCTALAFTDVRPEDKIVFGAIKSMCKNSYNKRGDHIVRTVGGGKLGLRSAIALKKRADALKKASLEKQMA